MFVDMEGMRLTLDALTRICRDGDGRQCRKTLAGIDHQAARYALDMLDADTHPDRQRRNIREFGDLLMRTMISVMRSV